MMVIGLDGATWHVIKPNLGELPAFKLLLDRYEHSTLECDVRPIHSAPSWTTIFSGLRPEEHGITEFVMEKEGRDELLKKKFIWDEVGRAIVMGVPISLPPININYDMRQWEKAVLSVTEDEMYGSTKKLVQDVKNAIEYGEADLVAAVFSEPDRAQHMFWHEPSVLLEHYKSIDLALSELTPYLEKDDFLILSDHGFTDAEETRRNGWDKVRENQTGGHHPEGIAIARSQPPAKVTEVHAFMSRLLKKTI